MPTPLGRRLRLVLVAAPLALPGSAGAECAPWPGEPAPLPTVRSLDAVAARWAVLRANELRTAAERLSVAAPSRAWRLRRHAACLDPWSGPAEPPRGVGLHRPVRGLAAPSQPPNDVDAALAALPLASGPPPVSAEPPGVTLVSLERAVRSARYEDALAEARALREVDFSSDSVARLEVLAATAALALGRDDEAQQSLARALAAEPSLELDPSLHSPKVLRALESAQSARLEGGRDGGLVGPTGAGLQREREP